MPIRPLRLPPLMCLTALLTACATAAPPPVEIRLVRTPIPAPLLIPPAPPVLPPPGTRLTQGRIAEVLLGYDAALNACAGQLAAITRLDAEGTDP